MADSSVGLSVASLFDEIERHAKHITSHRDEPCPYWEGRGCEAAMVHDADDILALMTDLREAIGHA